MREAASLPCQITRRRGRRALRALPSLLVTLSLLAVAFPAALATGEDDRDGPPPGYISEVLPNGLRVSILPEPANPVVATQVWYHVGSANEEPRTRGFAHLFEHLMFGGTERWSKQDLWRLHNDNGGEENAYTSWDETVYVSEIPPGPHAQVIEMEADRMVNLLLKQENLDNEKRIVTEELRVSLENDPQTRMLSTALKKVLGEHPYALTPVGTKEDIAAATLEHAREFYGSYYRPRNAHLVIVGPVDGPATLELVKRAFGPLPVEGTTPPDVPSLLGWQYPEMVRFSEDLPPVEIAFQAYPLPPSGSPDHWALAVMKELVTGGEINPFQEELVRRRRKALEAGTEMLNLRRGGVIAFYSASLPYRREATAFRNINETLAKLGEFEWLTEDSLASAKRKLASWQLRSAYFAAGRADAIGRAFWFHGDEMTAFRSTARLRDVTAGDVRAVFEKYLAQARPVRLYIKPERVPVMVRLFGWLYPLVKR